MVIKELEMFVEWANEWMLSKVTGWYEILKKNIDNHTIFLITFKVLPINSLDLKTKCGNQNRKSNSLNTLLNIQ